MDANSFSKLANSKLWKLISATQKVNCDILSLTFSPRNCEKTRENCDKKCQLPFVFFYSVSET